MEEEQCNPIGSVREPLIWIAAAFALVVAIVSSNVVITMALGFAAMFGLQYFGMGVRLEQMFAKVEFL